MNENEDLLHYGMPRRSGRYPWGSGDEPFQRSGDFLTRIQELKKSGMKETEIAEALGMSSTNELRIYESIAKKERRSDTLAKIKSLQGDGLSNVEIAAKLNLKGESTVRSLLNKDAEVRMNLSEKTAENLKKIVDEHRMLEVGLGFEKKLNISREKLNQALEMLRVEGYEVYSGRVPQATNKGKFTTLKVLAVPGTPHKDMFKYENIYFENDLISRDNGETLEPGFRYPASMDSKRIKIRYAEEGGKDKDGVVEIRRGVKDLSLGNSNYSQVRILVDDKYFMKGMALYSNNIPEGFDLVYNTNKSSNVDKMSVFKKVKDDPDNPFGSNIKEHGGQSEYIDDNGEKKLSLINKRADEGDWGEWSKELSAQFLSKQPMKLINKQLSLAAEDKYSEFNEILSLVNPTIKKKLLESFADDVDAASVHLKAASLPGQTYKVILPVVSLKDDEVYNTSLQDGTQVALVRYPHGGLFEIPILTVNNRNKEGRDILTTNPSDAIGINGKVAEILSGADFDGDTVMVIPLSDNTKIKSEPPLKQLEGFDNKLIYGPDEIKVINGQERYFRGGVEFKKLKETSTQNQMGSISNLITDMTLKGAPNSELARAVKHSMVIIDANKHNLDYKQSEIDNGIAALHKRYQTQSDEYGREHQGAATLISKSKSQKSINERKEGAFFAKDTGNPLILVNNDGKNKIFLDETTNKFYTEKEKRTLYIDPNTGKKLYHDTNREFLKVYFKDNKGEKQKASVIVKEGNMYYKDEDGKYIQVTNEKVIRQPAKTKSTKMAETDDAYTLSSGTPKEELYADYANKLKSLANQARKEIFVIKDIPYEPSAYKAYKDQVTSLEYKLNQALMNKPKERNAQTIAASIIKIKTQENPRMTSEQEKKISQRELARARIKVGAKRNEIKIDEKEWIAIQAGAITPTKLKQIIDNADKDMLKQLAMPRTIVTLSDSKIRRIKNMASADHTTSEIANALGISPSTVNKYLKGE
ncbi:helix-turn-helix domain-containing protein [bacterium]|nr:helix-turn-helix domain-containing protein [bacterium]